MREVEGGVTGLILDARGRPLPFSSDGATNAAARARDAQAVGLPVPAVAKAEEGR
ncbi:MAG: hypothetical protein N2595_06775 [bacterium]|nr:hypothetical protein [bacterium]